MKNKFKFIGLSVFAVLISLSSCNNDEQSKAAPATGKAPEQTVESTVALNSQSEIVQYLKGEADVVNAIANFDQPDWDNTTLASYNNTDNKAVIVPIGTQKFLTCYVTKEHKLIKTFVLSLEGSNALYNQVDYITPSGQPFLSIQMKDGAVTKVNNYDKELAQMRTNIDWKCFATCIGIAIRTGAGWLRAACSLCLTAPNVITCAPCVAAIAGSGIICAVAC